MADVDWSRWLPPAPLPDTGPKVFKAGQVWALRVADDDERTGVFGIGSPDGFMTVLAHADWETGTTGRCHPGGLGARHAVLVQDDGQPEPTPPEVLYGDRNARPAPVGELFPGDVITLTNPYAGALTWRLVELLEAAEVCQRWTGEPRQPDGAFCAPMRMVFGRFAVASVVPGWRAGQRRRVFAAKDHPESVGVLIGPTNSPRLWHMATEKGLAYLDPEWPSELIAEKSRGCRIAEDEVRSTSIARVPAEFEGRQPVGGSMEEQWRADPTDGSWKMSGAAAPPTHIRFRSFDVCGTVRGWRAGQRRMVTKDDGLVVTGTISQPEGIYWLLLDEGRAVQTVHAVSEAMQSHLLEEAPAARVVTPATLRKPEPNPRVETAIAKYKRLMNDAADATEAMEHSLRMLDEVESAETEKLFKDVYGAAFPPPPAPDDIVTVTLTLPGEVTMAPVTFTVPGPPLREVSSNGRDWVDYASLVDSDPFEAYPHRRVDGVEPTIYYLACRHSGGGLCKKPAEIRHIGGEPTELCNEHFVVNDGYDRSLTDNRPEAHAARIRMALMDINHGNQSVRPAGCDPTLFGGIWTTR